MTRRNVGDADVVVYSSAVRPSNPEMVAARERGLPVVPRAELLAELMRLREGIAIAGAHGKTTTTSMIALILDVAGLDPTAVIGGRVSSFGSNARLGRGKYLVAEADESDRSFLKLAPRYAVITNIDREHLEAYRDFDDLKAAFVQFANSVPANGVVILCSDDPHLQSMREVITAPYGDLRPRGRRRCHRGGDPNERVWRRLHGSRTEADGASGGAGPIAARGAGTTQRVERAWRGRAGSRAWNRLQRHRAALGAFHGVDRRFQRRGEASGVTVVEDYGHHPTEIAAVIAAAKPIASGRLIVAFQPHRFTRTQFLMNEFAPAPSQEPMSSSSRTSTAAVRTRSTASRSTRFRQSRRRTSTETFITVRVAERSAAGACATSRSPVISLCCWARDPSVRSRGPCSRRWTRR